MNSNLERSMQHLRGFGVSHIIFSLLKEGLLDDLKDGCSLEAIAEKRGLETAKLEAVFIFLVHEDILQFLDGHYRLTDYGCSLHKYAGHFCLFVGGYQPVLQDLLGHLQERKGSTRNGYWVSKGSCEIARYDTIPLTRDFLERHGGNFRSVVDIGCGTALYLTTLCQAIPGLEGVGVEPDANSVAGAIEHVKEVGLEQRIEIIQCDALSYNYCGEEQVVLANFVLQEILGQVGKAALLDFLRALKGKLAGAKFVVMEVDYAIEDESIMHSPMGLGFYNLYFMLHPLTQQQLLTKTDWNQLFEEAGFIILEQQSVDKTVDPTGLVIGYVMR